MNRHRRSGRIIATVIGAAWLCAIGGAQPAAAETDDERFAAAVAAMEIPTTPEDDLPAVGHRICDWLTSGLARNVNVVPTVRGVVNTLANSGMTRGQAAGLMKVSVAIYCPEHGSIVGR